MARRKGIFGRRRDRESEPIESPAPLVAEDEPSTELQPAVSHDPSKTEDWEPPRRVVHDFETGDWASPPDPVEAAAQDAKIRSMDEILALEADLEQANSSASEEVDELDSRLRNAETRAQQAEQRAETVARTLQETLARLEDAERRATAAEQARTEAGRDSRRAGAGADETARERVARIESDAEERIRAEVAVARKAAEERFAENLATRERELEREREQKVRLLEDTNRRLSQIEDRAVEAAERVNAAERRLAEEAKHLRADAEEHVAAEAQRARTDAAEAADARVRQRESELAEALAASERAEREAAVRVEEAQERERAGVEAAEQRARESEAAGAATASEARVAAASWLRGQAKALRNEGGHGTREEIVAAEESVREAASAEAAERIDEMERGWQDERSAFAAELAAARRLNEEVVIRASEAEARAERAEVALSESGGRQQETRFEEAKTRIELATAEVEAATERAAEGRRRSGFRGLFDRGVPRPVAADVDRSEGEAEDAEHTPLDPIEPEFEPETGSSTRSTTVTEGVRVSVSSAGFEELRSIGFSVTQAKRLIRYRDGHRLDSVEGLEEVPGFPRAFLDTVRDRIRD